MFNLPQISESFEEAFSEAMAAVCFEECEYRWGNNCFAHWRDENEPRWIESTAEMVDILRALPPWDSWRVQLEKDELPMILIEYGDARENEVLLVTERQLYDCGIHPNLHDFFYQMTCPKHVQKKRWLSCTCL